jgi:enoyl-CoA hydratase/carnithine racemase
MSDLSFVAIDDLLQTEDCFGTLDRLLSEMRARLTRLKATGELTGGDEAARARALSELLDASQALTRAYRAARPLLQAAHECHQMAESACEAPF